MSEATILETPTTKTEGETAAAAATSLLTGTEGAATPEQQAAEEAAAAAAADPAKAAADAAAAAAAAKAAEDAAKAAAAKPEGAPEKYDFKAPEGKEYDAAVLEPFSEAAKAANLTQDAAQKLLETMAPKLAERHQAQVAAIQAGWADASKADAEFGGDKLQENLAVAKKALDTFAPKNADGTDSGFRKLLAETGLGNNPEVIRVLVRVGKAIGEDGFVAGGKNAGAEKSTAEVLYGNTPKQSA